ncbi:hypothetical protein [Streptomyces sp. NPDC088785]|uniref:hypothetical protein n=1 Tax=Streptomyces sp. NPDC088785 TaxID=3365897 RepID=UPI0038221317
MSAPYRRPAARSPLVSPAALGSVGPVPVPAAHTRAELDTVVGLLRATRPPVHCVAVGHGRDGASLAATDAFVRAWRDLGGTVVAVVDWPEEAASWLRAARRLTESAPDAWVFCGALPGFAQLARRLRHEGHWDPARSVAFGALGDSRLPELTGADVLEGLRGARADGGVWWVEDDGRVHDGPPPRPPRPPGPGPTDPAGPTGPTSPAGPAGPAGPTQPAEQAQPAAQAGPAGLGEPAAQDTPRKRERT